MDTYKDKETTDTNVDRHTSTNRHMDTYGQRDTYKEKQTYGHIRGQTDTETHTQTIH